MCVLRVAQPDPPRARETGEANTATWERQAAPGEGVLASRQVFLQLFQWVCALCPTEEGYFLRGCAVEQACCLDVGSPRTRRGKTRKWP